METNAEKENFLNLMNYMHLDGWDKALDDILDCIIDGIDDYGEMSQMPMYNVRWLQKIIRALKESPNPEVLVQSIAERIKK